MTAPTGPLSPALRPLTWVAARFYGVGAKIAAARVAKSSPERLDLPVISVGNITAGGTGKSPFASHLAKALRAAGSQPAIALRGYRSEKTGGSDEAAEYKQHIADMPIIVGPNRAEQVRAYQATHPNSIDVVLLDDGFQHRRLHRDLDIVLVDCSRPGLDGDLLPHGWLREPATALARADIVVLTHATGNDEHVEEQVRRVRGRTAEVSCRHAWDGIEVYEPGQAEDSIPVAEALSRFGRVAIASGVGNPNAFATHVRTEGFEVREEMRFRDHAVYDERAVGRIAANARKVGALLVTGKDWVKLRKQPSIASLDVPVLVPRMSIIFVRGADTLAVQLQETCGHAVSL